MRAFSHPIPVSEVAKNRAVTAITQTCDCNHDSNERSDNNWAFGEKNWKRREHGAQDTSRRGGETIVPDEEESRQSLLLFFRLFLLNLFLVPEILHALSCVGLQRCQHLPVLVFIHAENDGSGDHTLVIVEVQPVAF